MSKIRRRRMGDSIENHSTAAWADVERTKSISGVTIPGEMQMMHAKEHVDENQK